MAACSFCILLARDTASDFLMCRDGNPYELSSASLYFTTLFLLVSVSYNHEGTITFDPAPTSADTPEETPLLDEDSDVEAIPFVSIILTF